MKNLWILLLINLVIALIYYWYHYRKGDKRRGFVCSLFIFAVPGIGFMCLGMAKIYNVVFATLDTMEDHVTNIEEEEEELQELLDIDMEKESDKIPLEEAMLISDRKNRRKVLLDILKREKDETMMRIIKDATTDKDTEVSHYAITFITDSIANFRKKEEAAAKYVKEYPSPEARLRYIKCLYEILQPDYFTRYEQEKYIETLDEQVLLLRKEDKQSVTGIILEEVMEFWYRSEDQEKIEEYLSYAEEIQATDLQAAKLCLKYYYKTGNKEKFKQLLLEIKTSTLEIDSEVLSWIRFYNII